MIGTSAMDYPRPALTAKLSTVGLLAFIGAFFVPMKALALDVGGQSLYLPYIALALGAALMLPRLVSNLLTHFGIPIVAVVAFSLFHFWQFDYEGKVFVFAAKIIVTLALAALYVILLEIDEASVMTWLYRGCLVSIIYMAYQAISLAKFGGSLPFTAVNALSIGRGFGERYGLIRTTGFTEEPSYIAVMLIGSMFMLRSYEKRSGESQSRRYWVLVVGMLLCTSNNLFATIPLLLIFYFFFRLRATVIFFVLFYLASLTISPYVLNLDETFFARFSSYNQFLHLAPSQWWTGIGFNRYSDYTYPVYVSPEGLSTFVVDSIASLWGGLLLEGGILFAALFCGYLIRVTEAARDATGFALMAILIMLANYYSPWWPIVSLALAYTVVSRTKPVENHA